MRLTLLFLGCVLLSACAGSRIGSLSAECSGVPGDFRTPADHDSLAGSSSRTPIDLVAEFRPATAESIPWLYVFDENATYVNLLNPRHDVLLDPAFVAAENAAYWGEIVDGHYYLVPRLDKCSITSMLESPISFLAPHDGLLLIQFVASDCAECNRIDLAIRALIAQHPELPVRWLRIEVPSSIGQLR